VEILHSSLTKRWKNIWLKNVKRKMLPERRMLIIMKHHEKENWGDVLWIGGLKMNRIMG